MAKDTESREFLAEQENLRTRLREAEETLRAISSGEADAIVLSGGEGASVRLLGDTDRVYRQFLETANEGTATVSTDGKILSCNAAFAKTVRQPLAEVVGADLATYLLPEEYNAVSSILREPGGESYRQKVSLRACDGGLIPEYVSVTRLESPVQEPVLCMVFTDLRQVESAESTLLTSEKLYRELLDLAPVGIAVISDGKVSFVNPAGANLLGAHTEAQVVGKSVEEVIHSDSLERAQSDMTRLLAGETRLYRSEDVLLRLDGTLITVEILATPLRYMDRPAIQVIMTDISEQEQAKKELEFRNILLSTQQEASIDAILVVDENASILSRNRKFNEMWGIPPELVNEKVDEPILRIVSDLAVDSETFLRRVDHLYSHKDEASHDELLLKDGRIIDRYSAPMIGPAKSYLGRVWYFRDITERKRAEADLRFHKATLEETGRLAKIGGWSLDAVSGGGFWTDEVARIYDLDPSLPCPRDVGLQYHVGESHARIEAAVKDAIDRKIPFDLELEIVSAKGVHKWARTIGHPVVDGGRVTRVMGSFQDVTERKRGESERERLMFAMEQVVDTVIITDPDGIMQYANTTFERVSGYTRSEVIGKNPRILKSGQQSREFYRELWTTISSGEIWRGTIVNRRKDGNTYTVESTISPVRDSSGRIVNYVEVNHDVSAQRLMEERLRQAQKMETVGQLAGGVAHDFNNMLQVIITYTEMALGMVEPGERLHKYLFEIRRAAQRSAEMTAQLLAFARRQTVTPKILDLNDSVSGSRKMIQRLIGDSIDFVWVPGHDLWKLKMDPTQLDQILANLAVNARDAIGGVGKLTIGTHNVVLDDAYCALNPGFIPGKYVLLAVSDDGCGMDKATLSHLFEPFFTTKEQGKGTGLGLATVYGIVRQNNGFISVYSEPEQGTTFKVYLPRTTEAPGDDAVDVEPEFNEGGTETMLVVEDEGAILELARESLEQLGYTVLTAGSPDEAILRFEEHSETISLLITDVIMPQMNGRQLAERLIALRPGLKCLYMSGYSADVMGHRGILTDDMKFIAKPFSVGELAEKVREVIDH